MKTFKYYFNESLQLAETPKFKTGVAVSFLALHNTQKSPKLGSRYQQDIELSGYYINIINHKPPEIFANWEISQVHSNKPLVIYLNSESNPESLYDGNSWKAQLKNEFKATGKALTKKLIAKGYDAIITIDKKNGEPSECVLLKPGMAVKLEESAPRPDDNVAGPGPVRVTDAFSLVLGNHISQNIPLSPEMLSKLFGTRKPCLGVHILGFDKIQSLLDIQGSHNAVSISTNVTPDKLNDMAYKGMLGGSGYVAKVAGRVLVAADHDLYSLLDSQGNRWIRTQALVDYVSDDVHTKELLNKLRLIINDVNKELLAKVYIELSGNYVSFANLKSINQQQLADDIKAMVDILPEEKCEQVKTRVISRYFNLIEKILHKNKEILVQVLYDMAGIKHENDAYNEVIVNHIKVLELLVLPNKQGHVHFDAKVFHGSDLESKVKVIFVDDNTDLRQSWKVSRFLEGLS